MTQAANETSKCVHVTTQAELDAQLQRDDDVCIHVRNDAEESVKAWDEEYCERQAQITTDRAAARERDEI